MDDSEQNLFDAVQNGDEKLVKDILQKQQINLNVQDDDDDDEVQNSFFFRSFFSLQDPPLHDAASNGFEGIVKILIEHGANVDLQNKVIYFFDFIFLCWCFIDLMIFKKCVDLIWLFWYCFWWLFYFVKY